jgi:hypothetical protein
LGPLENQQIDLTSNRLYLNTDELADHLNTLYDITILTTVTSRLLGLFLDNKVADELAVITLGNTRALTYKYIGGIN